MLLARERSFRSVCLVGLIVLLLLCAPLTRAQPGRATAASSDAALSGVAANDNVNIAIELYLLSASDGPSGGASSSRLPKALETVLRQLRATLPFENYRLTATMLSRIRNGGRLNVKGVGATPFSNVTAPAPLFSDYFVNSATLKNDATGRAIIELLGFRFGAHIPIQTSTVAFGKSDASPPQIQYETTGISTDFSMREGEPVIVGTLNVGQPGEVFILVVSARRTPEQ